MTSTANQPAVTKDSNGMTEDSMAQTSTDTRLATGSRTTTDDIERISNSASFNNKQDFFHVVRKSDYLHGPALFLTWKDVQMYMDNLQDEMSSSTGAAEHKQFEMLWDALEYMLGAKPTANEMRRSQVEVPINNNPVPIRNLTKQQQPQQQQQQPLIIEETNASTQKTGAATAAPPLTDDATIAPAVATETSAAVGTSLDSMSPGTIMAQATTEDQATNDTTTNDENDDTVTTNDAVPTRKRGRPANSSKQKSSPTKKKKSITPGQRKRKDRFEHFFRLLLQYKSEFGECDIPTENKHLAVGKYSGLGQWYVRILAEK